MKSKLDEIKNYKVQTFLILKHYIIFRPPEVDFEKILLVHGGWKLGLRTVIRLVSGNGSKPIKNIRFGVEFFIFFEVGG